MKRLLSILLFIPVLGFSQYTAIPDENFEHRLQIYGYDDISDGQVLTANINSIETLGLPSNGNITDLTGIEDFSALTHLYCEGNQLTSLDVSQNTALTYLDCGSNQITSLDISGCTALTDLRCNGNNLMSLDVSQNTALTDLSCWNNQLTSLDVSNNTALEYLTCDWNYISSLDVSQNTALTHLGCSANGLTCLNIKNGNNTNLSVIGVDQNYDLFCIEVDDTNWSNQNWTVGFNEDVTFSTNCNYPDECSGSSSGGPYTLIPDQNFEQALIDLGHDDVIDGQVLTANISGLESLEVGYEGISDLSGIEDFTALTYFEFYWNQVTSLDLSQNTALVEIVCIGNQLTSLDLSQNTALASLYCYKNQLTSLDVSGCTALSYLNCYENELISLDVSNNIALTGLNCRDNQLTCLNLKNGNNYNMNLNATQNPNLTCVEVDDPDWANYNWTTSNGSVDGGVTFSINCNYPIGCGGSTCNNVSVADTTNYFVSDVNFENISPEYSLTTVDTFANDLGCDSLIFRYNKYIFNPNYYTDSIVTNDTNIVSIYDTTNVYDTVIVDLVDTSYVTIEDTVTTYQTVYDTITTYDTSYVSLGVTDTLFIDITTGISNITNTISIYPNPANEFITINNGDYSSMTNYELRIINPLGQVVFNNLIYVPQFIVPVSSLGAEGTYFVQVLDGDGNLVVTKYLILN